MVLSFVFSLIVSLADYISDEFIPKLVEQREGIVSLTAGISVSYIFLQLLPDVYESVDQLDRYVFISLLVGFILFHLAEKHIYKHMEKRRKRDLTRVHLAGLFVYHFIIGILLVKFTEQNLINGILLFVPVTLHTALSNLASHGIQNYQKKSWKILSNRGRRVFLSLAPLYGAVGAWWFGFPPRIVAMLTSFIAGILLYIVIRETIPKDKEGNPRLFVIGSVLYSLFIIVTWLIKI